MKIVSTKKFMVFEYINEDEKQREKIYNDICKAIDICYDTARDISREERSNMEDGHRFGNLTYGEIPYDSMKTIFDVIKNEFLINYNQTNTIFNLYDLGSGSGGSTLAAALQLSFKKVIGIEILSGLYNMSKKIKTEWQNSKYNNNNTSLDFINGSILSEWDWCDYDNPCIIFANSTCFNDEMFDMIKEQGKKMKQGSYIITLSIPINIKKFRKIEVLKELRLEMSWGESDVFIHLIN